MYILCILNTHRLMETRKKRNVFKHLGENLVELKENRATGLVTIVESDRSKLM